MKSWLIVASVILCCALLFYWFYRTQTVWVDSAPYRRSVEKPAKTLVVVYSRTGNTLGVAKVVASYFDADLLTIDAPLYTRDYKGQRLAERHADDEVTMTPITHDSVDVSQYDLVFLCSPTWWYRPAVPLWSFVENHDFAGKEIFLMMTGNSRMKEGYIAKFATLVEKQNGKFLGMHFLQRGRVYWQKEPSALEEETLAELRERNKIWPVDVESIIKCVK
ncbi:MAG: hypothetical protein GY808_08895 [Gammaproteobacteria bacterium]|nr:hypothetical protein [Gammaproteobacteria bacterium]